MFHWIFLVCFVVSCWRGGSGWQGKLLKFSHKGEVRLKVPQWWHLFATLDCKNDENYYHLYTNWGTQNGDLKNLEIATKFTWSFFFLDPEVKHPGYGQAGEKPFIYSIFTQYFSFFFFLKQMLTSILWYLKCLWNLQNRYYDGCIVQQIGSWRETPFVWCIWVDSKIGLV